MEIKPIRTQADHDSALRRIEALWGAAPKTRESDELEVLVTLVEAYERQHHTINLPDPIDAIKFRLEQEGKDYRALIGIIGQRTRVYEVMRKARPLSLNMIRRLHKKMQIPAQVLIQPGPRNGRQVSRGTRRARPQARPTASQRRG